MAIAMNKSELEARNAELEALLANSPDLKLDQVVLVGMLRAVKPLESQNPNAKFQVTAILTNNTRETINGNEQRVDLPIDGIIASDNGNGPLATQLLELARTNKWARVRVGGFWVRRGEIQIRNGYMSSTGKHLRVQSLQVLNAEPLDEPVLEAPVVEAFAEPTSEEINF
jgi:hypothetical protein